MADIWLKNCEYIVPSGQICQGDIGISGSMILFTGTAPLNWQADEIIDCTGKLVIPGFVNAHTHAAMTLFRGYGCDLALMDWLQTKIWPAEAKLVAEDIYWATQLAIAEMLASGTTTFADMYFFMDEVAKSCIDSGIRAVLSRGMAGVAPTAETALVESDSFFRNFNGAADGRISVMLGPHAPYTCPPDYLRRVVELAQKLGAQIHIHLSETKGEVDECQKKYGKTPIALMNDLGVLDLGVLAAHCVWVTQDDIALMKQKNVRVAHNPTSNMKLASGTAPVVEMLSAGLTVGIGTDGASSNDNLDMLEELRMATLLQKLNKLDPTALPAIKTISIATAGSASAVGLTGVTGEIKVGMKADLTILGTSGPHWQPKHDLAGVLVYSAQSADVQTTIVDGKILYHKGQFKTIDIERTIAETSERGFRLVQP